MGAPGIRLGRGVFSFVASGFRAGPLEDGVDVAAPVLVDKVSCPYCGSFYRVMALGPLRRRVDRRPFLESGGRRVPNPAFRESHLANPVKCPSCGRVFRVFVGVEYDRKRGLRSVDVKPMAESEEVKELVRWPHAGVVTRYAIHYTPFRAAVYESLRDLEEAVLEEDQDGAGASIAWSLPEMAGHSGPAQAEGGKGGERKPQPVTVVEVDGGPPPGLG